MEALQRVFFQGEEYACLNPKEFETIFEHDPLLCVQLLLQIRDKKRGLGRRDYFVRIFIHLATVKSDSLIFEAMLPLIPLYGTWKDLTLIATALNENSRIVQAIVLLFATQLRSDLLHMKAGKPISTASKWFPMRPSAKSKGFVSSVKQLLRTNEEGMRKEWLGPLRAYLGLVEIKMSKCEWGSIVVSKLPQVAKARYEQSLKRRGIKVVAPKVKLSVPTVEKENNHKRAIVFDSASQAECALRAILSSPNSVQLYSFTSTPIKIEASGSDLQAKINSLRAVPSDKSSTLELIEEETIIVITDKPLPCSLQLESKKKILWWRSSPTIDLKQWNCNVVELFGFSHSIYQIVIDGYDLNAERLIFSALNRYRAHALTCTTSLCSVV